MAVRLSRRANVHHRTRRSKLHDFLHAYVESTGVSSYVVINAPPSHTSVELYMVGGVDICHLGRARVSTKHSVCVCLVSVSVSNVKM